MRRLLLFCALLSESALAAPVDVPNKTLVFENMLSKLSAESSSVVSEVVAYLQSHPSIDVWISGPGDLTKPPTYDQILARNRMLQTFRLLTEAGVDPARIVIQSKGAIPKGAERDTSRRRLQLAFKERGTGKAQTASLAPSQGSKNSHQLTFTPNEPKALSGVDQGLNSFLGQHVAKEPARIKVSAHAAGDKSELYAVPMQRLRGLTTFELLVRTGFPPKRIVLESPEDTNAAMDKNTSGDRNTRNVVLSWIDVPTAETPAAAPVAAAPEAPAAEQPKAPTEPVAEAKPAPEQPASSPSSLEALLAVGSAIPTGKMASVSKNDFSFGLGLRGTFLGDNQDGWSWRGNVTRLSFKPKKGGQRGSLDMTSVQAGVEKFSDLGIARLYGGVLLGAHIWNGKIKETATGKVNKDSKTDFGGTLVLGAAFQLTEQFSIGPDLQWSMLGGGFSGNYFTPALLLAWRF